ncbi:MAG: Crp/Fnr family transcriptional regulator [Rhodospirillales bacterium]
METANATRVSLAQTPLFRGLPADVVVDLEAATRCREFAAGDVVLVAEADRPHDFFVVLDGIVQLVRDVGDHRPLRLAEVGPGGWFGEFAVIDGRSGSATARARSPALIAVVPRGKMIEVLAGHPLVALRIMERMVEVIRQLDDRIACFHGVDDRIDAIHRELLRLTI